MTQATQQLPSISLQELQILSGLPGTLKVIVKQVNGRYLPIVHHTTPEGDTKLHGIIKDGNNVLATVELADVTTALEEIIGLQHELLTPETPDGTTMH